MPSNSYSTGSSSVMILTSGELISFKQAYSDVVFPLPVGPVARMIPCGLRIMRSKSWRLSSVNPSSVSPNSIDCRSRIRSTTLSPWSVATVGTVETRRSICRLPTLAICLLILPSCGRRRSATSISAMILILEVIADWR